MFIIHYCEIWMLAVKVSVKEEFTEVSNRRSSTNGLLPTTAKETELYRQFPLT